MNWYDELNVTRYNLLRGQYCHPCDAEMVPEEDGCWVKFWALKEALESLELVAEQRDITEGELTQLKWQYDLLSEERDRLKEERDAALWQLLDLDMKAEDK